MKKINLVIFLSCFFVCSCKFDFSFFPRKDSIENRAPKFVHFEDYNLQESKFCVLLYSDSHFGKNDKTQYAGYEDVFLNRLEKVLPEYKKNGYEVLFSINIGDSAETGKKVDYDKYGEFRKKLENRLKKITNKDILIYEVIGNHDLYNDGFSLFKELTKYESTSFYFDTISNGKTISWYFGDSASSTFGRAQINNLCDLVQKNPNPKVFTSHCPIYTNQLRNFVLHDPIEISKMMKIFGNNNFKLVLEGHYHPGEYKELKNNDGELLFIERGIPSFADKNTFGIVKVDCSQNEPTFEVIIENF